PQNQFPSGNYGAIAPGQLTPNLNGTPPSPSLKTDMLGTPQGDQPTNTYRNILPGQSSPGFSSMPTINHRPLLARTYPVASSYQLREMVKTRRQTRVSPGG